MEAIKINNTTVEIEGFYRINIDTAEKYIYDAFLNDFMPQLAKNKKEFYEQIKGKNAYGMSTTKSFFADVLEYEIKLKKDLIEFTREEVKDMIMDMAKNKKFATRSLYNSYTSIIYNYMVWGYNHEPRLRYDIVKNKDFKISYQDMLDKDAVYNQLLTHKEIKEIIPLLDNDMNEGLVLMAMSGLMLSEALNLKIDDVKNAKDNVLKLKYREIKVNQNVYDKLLDLCYKTTEQRQFRKAVKEQKLAETDYVIRIIATSRSKNTPVNTATASNNLSKDLSNAGYDGTYTDLKISSMLNDYLDGMELAILNNKYGVKFGASDLPAVYKVHLKILKKKRQQKE